MRLRIDVGDNGSKGSLVVEVPRWTSATAMRDNDVPARALFNHRVQCFDIVGSAWNN